MSKQSNGSSFPQKFSAVSTPPSPNLNEFKKKPSSMNPSLSASRNCGVQLDSSFASQQASSQMNNSAVINGNTGANNGINNAFQSGILCGENYNRNKQRAPPGRAKRVMEGMMEKYEQFKGLIEKQIKPNKFQLSDEEIQKLTVQLADFDEYKAKIGNEFAEYQNQKKTQTGSFEDNLQDMHLNRNLLNCYKRVPKDFFVQMEDEDSFPFLLDVKKQLKQIKEYQNQLVEHLDEVELNLFYQVYFRFNQILEMILNFDKMGKKVEENLVKVKGVKQMNAKLKNTLCAGGNAIIKKKRAFDRIKTVFSLLLKMKEYNESKDVQLSEDPIVIQILNPQDQEGVKNKLNQISLFKTIQRKYEKVSQIKERDFYSDFLDESGKYLGKSLAFAECAKSKGSQVEHSIDVSSIHSYSSQLHGDSWIKLEDEEEEIEEGLQVFEWTCASEEQRDFDSDLKAEIEISRLYIVSSHNFDTMRFEVFTNNVNKELKKFIMMLQKQFKDYCIKLYRLNNKQLIYSSQEDLQFLNDINDILLMKFSSFYSDLIKQFLVRSLRLLATIKNQIIQNGVNINSPTSYWEQKIIPIVSAFARFQLELVDSMTNDFLGYIKYTDTSTDANIVFKLTTSNTLFSYWIDSFPTYFNECTSLDFSNAKNLSPDIQEQLIKNNQEAISTFNPTYFYTEKSDMHLELFATFHEKQTQLLEFALTQDIWIPCTLSYKIYSLLDFFFKERDDQAGNSEEDDEEEEEKKQFNKVRNQIIKDDSEEEEEEEDLQDLNNYYLKKSERKYKIQLNRVTFEGEENKYSLTEGMVLFLRQLMRYIQLLNYSQTLYGKEKALKVISIMRFYNTCSREFLVLTKGIKYKQMANKITVKNLSSSAINLSFLMRVLGRMQIKLTQLYPSEAEFIEFEISKLTEEVENHSNEIFTTVLNIMKDPIQKAALQVSLLGWHKTQEKINVPLVQTAKVLDQIRTMHAVLEEVLNYSQLRYIFDQILSDFTEVYLKTLSQVLKSPDANRLSAQRVKEEVTYIANEILEIQTVQVVPSSLVFATTVETIVSLDQIPKLLFIKNKAVFGHEEEAPKKLPSSSQKSKQDQRDEEIEKISQKFQSQIKEDVANNNQIKEEVENDKITCNNINSNNSSNIHNLSNAQDTTCNSSHQEPQDNILEEDNILSSGSTKK